MRWSPPVPRPSDWVRLAINTGMGWPPGGPWITPQYRSKHLAWQAREISGHDLQGTGASADSMVLAWKLDRSATARPWRRIVRSLTGSIQWQGESGSVRWDVPGGWWLIGIFRVTLGGLCDKGNGPEADPGSREAVLFHLNHVFGRLDPRLSKYYGTTLIDVTSDSWEYERGGNRYWSPAILDAFAKLAGYDLREKMHALLGYGPEQQQVVADLEKAERAVIRENFFETFTGYLNARGLGHRPQVRGRGLRGISSRPLPNRTSRRSKKRSFFPRRSGRLTGWANRSSAPRRSRSSAATAGTWNETANSVCTRGRPWIRSGDGRRIRRCSAGMQGPICAGRKPNPNAHLELFAAGRPASRLANLRRDPLESPVPVAVHAASAHLARGRSGYSDPASRRPMRQVYPVRSSQPDGRYNSATDQPASALNAIDAASPYTLSPLKRPGGASPYDFSRLALIDDAANARRGPPHPGTDRIR